MKHCPDQIILASEDWKIFVVLWMSIYFEQWLGQHPTVVHIFTTNDDEFKGPTNVKVQSKCWARTVGHLGLILDGTVYSGVRQALQGQSINLNCWAV